MSHELHHDGADHDREERHPYGHPGNKRVVWSTFADPQLGSKLLNRQTTEANNIRRSAGVASPSTCTASAPDISGYPLASCSDSRCQCRSGCFTTTSRA